MIKSVIYANQLSTYQSIKKKARILMQESCTLIGVVDETGLLEPDEIFVQIRKDNFSEREFADSDPFAFADKEEKPSHILTSQLLVTRNPCLNPGDLRLL